MKKFLFGTVLGLGLMSAPLFVSASTLTDAQIQSILNLLTVFGADSAMIAQVNAALTGTSVPTSTPQGWCHTFSKNLGVGSKSEDVIALDSVLSKEISNYKYRGGDNPYYDESTAVAVVNFQSKYGISKTGYVGPLTRAKLNTLYGCKGIQPVPQPTSTSTTATNIDAPQIISIEPSSARVGSAVTIKGSNFSGAGIVIDGTVSPTTYQTENLTADTIIFYVPSTLSIGTHTVQVAQAITGTLSDSVKLNIITSSQEQSFP